jgi:type I restriction enzyme M protein
MSDESSRIGQKLWSYCNVLRDDGLSYQDYLEQLTFLLFLKMADERAVLTGGEQSIPEGYRWGDLSKPDMEGVKLEAHYRETLEVLGKQGGMLGLIFRKAQNKIQDPAKLRQLIVELIGKETWTAMSSDVKGDAYEDLLERNAQDIKPEHRRAGDVPGTPGHLSVIVDEPPGVDPACLEVLAGHGPIPKPSGDLSIIDG